LHRHAKGLALSIVALAIAACTLNTEGASDVDIPDARATPSGANTVPHDASRPAMDAADDVIELDASDNDVTEAPDARATGDAVQGGTADCDHDHDGHRATSCGGDDCCDLDQRTFPGQKSFFDQPDACETFDYDCDGKAAPQFGRVNCKLGFLSCNGDGFSLDTACGTQGEFDTCGFIPLFVCRENKSTRVQQCH